LKTVGLPESHLDARVEPIARKYPSVRVGFRTHAPENHLKLLAEDRNEADARATLEAFEREARVALDPFVFGADADELQSVAGAALRARGHTLAVAESCTGGLVSALVVAAAGASEYFLGGAVTYAEVQKQRWAGVPSELLAAHGAVSDEVTRALAEGVRKATGSTWGLGVTGYAGPSAFEGPDDLGTVYCALAGPPGTVAERHRFAGDRERIRRFAAHAALDLLRRSLR
jgi:nicotinamide-nucleotide amidase